MPFTRRGYKGGCAMTTLVSDVSPSTTAFVGADLSSWAGVATTGPFGLCINRGQSDEEQCVVTNLTGNNLTGVIRGVGGTTAQAHGAGATLEHATVTMDFDEANAHVSDQSLDNHPQYVKTDGTRAMTGQLTITVPTPVTSLHITRGVADFATHGSIRMSRASQAEMQGILFEIGTVADPVNMLMGREPNSADLLIAKHDGSNLTRLVNFNTAGSIIGYGEYHYFGVWNGTTPGARLKLGGIAGGATGAAVVWAEGSQSDVTLNMRSKGAGEIQFANAAGSYLLRSTSTGDLLISQSAGMAGGRITFDNLNAVWSGSATAGGTGALPATVRGYVSVNVTGVGEVKIPVYSP